MRVACSFVLSALLLFSNILQSAAQSKQDAKDQQPVQKPEAPPLKQPLAFGLEDGTPIKLRLTRNLSSADATTGDRVDFEVLEDVKVKDVIVVPRGGLALATITEAEHKRRMARGGKLNVNIDDVRLADGEKAPLRAVKEAKGGGHTGAMTGAIVGTAIVFFPAAPLFLFMHGKDITIPKGTEITAYINGDIPLDPKRFVSQMTATPEAGAAPGQPTASATAAQNGSAADPALSTVDLKSTPDGAEITVDEKFMGSTPSSLRLAAGEHKIKLEKSGFKTWERTMTVSAGATVTVNATLEKQGDRTF
ncbi:MAG: PEGA domain-containing protein [Acidobacteria bacterium]|nr:MAG: PEGA domain-containing protein [Acidobacteriota bacterium]